MKSALHKGPVQSPYNGDRDRESMNFHTTPVPCLVSIVMYIYVTKRD